MGMGFGIGSVFNFAATGLSNPVERIATTPGGTGTLKKAVSTSVAVAVTLAAVKWVSTPRRPKRPGSAKARAGFRAVMEWVS